MLTDERWLNYQNFWRQVARSTQSVEQIQAIPIVQKLYQRFGLPSPQVVLMPSPNAAKIWIEQQMSEQWLRRSPWRILSLLPVLLLSGVGFCVGFIFGVFLFELIFPPVIGWLKPLPDWLTFIPEYLLAFALIGVILGLPFMAMGKSIQWLMRSRAVLKNLELRRHFGAAIADKITKDLFDPMLEGLLKEGNSQVYTQVWAKVNTAL
jgi:hypothetical protein